MKSNILLILVVILIVAYFAGYEKLFYITVGAAAVSAVGEIKVSGGLDYDFDWHNEFYLGENYKPQFIEAYHSALKEFIEANPEIIASDTDKPWYEFNITPEGGRLYYDMVVSKYEKGLVPDFDEFLITDWVNILPLLEKVNDLRHMHYIHDSVRNQMSTIKSANKR